MSYAYLFADYFAESSSDARTKYVSRHSRGAARIEVGAEDIEKILNFDTAKMLDEPLRMIGFTSVTVDHGVICARRGKRGERLIYLDNAASTAVRPEVLDEVIQILSKQYGNPSSIHGYGRAAEKTINIARRHVATLIGLPGEILFTSGGTESNNMAIHGVMRGTGHI